MQLEFGGRRVTVTAADLVIGSDPEASLVVAAPGVLPEHARVRLRTDGATELAPGQPGALVLLNGARVGPGMALLNAGDRIVVGDREIIVLELDAPAGASQRLNVTMMGMPAFKPGSPSPEAPAGEAPDAPRRPGPASRVGLIPVAIAAALLLAYFLLRN